MTDKELTTSLKALVKAERSRSVDILNHLNEMDRRHLAERSGYPSLFEYCVRELRYVNGTAARLIHSARAAKKYPLLFRTIERGLLSVTTASMLAPHLKWDNHRRLIRAAAGKSAREVEALIASLAPVAKAPAERVRFISVAKPAPARAPEELFAPDPAAESAAAALPQHQPSVVAATVPVEPPLAAASPVERPVAAPMPVAPAASASPTTPAAPSPPVPPAPPAQPPAAVNRVVFTFTGDEGLFRDVERAKELSRHKWPAGRLEDVFSGAIKALLARIDPDKRERRRERVRRLAAGVRSRSRHIAKAVKDEVWRRDGGRCAYLPEAGKICGSRASLEFDHVRPWALGGSNETANIRLLCRTHNDLEARRVFGEAAIAGAVDRRRGALRRQGEI